MKQIWKDLGLAVLLGVVAPWLILGIATAAIRSAEGSVVSIEPTRQERQDAWIYVLKGDKAEPMELSEYLTGVLLCEMPGSFAPEAKKAQAVVARTYALRTVSVKNKHPQAAVCTDPACCQGYTAPEAFLLGGGDSQTLEQARQAVADTQGVVLLYDGELIDATYFSCSGGHTEDALAVWGTDVPYLQGVVSPGEQIAAFYTDSAVFSAESFQTALGVTLPGEPAHWFGKITYTDGGGVDTVVIGGKTYRGTQVRNLLGLRSTAFTVTAVGNSIVITTRGYGHRVGMSQYGAQAMALAGKSCEEILLHYYSGAVLGQK